MPHKTFTAIFFAALGIFGRFLVPSAHAILITDDFSYAETNGLAASHLLATDFPKLPGL